MNNSFCVVVEFIRTSHLNKNDEIRNNEFLKSDLSFWAARKMLSFRKVYYFS